MSPVRLGWIAAACAVVAACQGVVGIEGPVLDPGVAPDAAVIDAPPAEHVVSVAFEGTGAGRVTSSPAGIDCPGTCAAAFAEGTAVTLTAAGVAPAEHTRWRLPDSCGDSADCTLTIDAPTATSVRFDRPHNIVFVTPDTVAGNFGGAAEADAICAQLAAEAGLPDGPYVAWISDSSADAVDRIGDIPGWIRTDGLPFAQSKATMLAGEILYPIRLDHLGNDLGSVGVFTGTAADGTRGLDCGDWTKVSAPPTFDAGFTGSSGAGFRQWTGDGTLGDCGVPAHLYCMGDDPTKQPVAAPVLPNNAPVIWVSQGTFAPGGGIAPAIALCGNEGGAGGQSGISNVLIALGGQSPAATMLLPGDTFGPGQWYRPDGVAVASGVGDFINGRIQAPINQQIDGTSVTGEVAWLGTRDLDQIDPTFTCNDWTATAGQGAATLVNDSAMTSLGNTACNSARRVFCFDQPIAQP